jgi:hypothetical protein
MCFFLTVVGQLPPNVVLDMEHAQKLLMKKEIVFQVTNYASLTTL